MIMPCFNIITRPLATSCVEPWDTTLTGDTLATPHPSPLPQEEREQETSLCAPAPLLPPWEKGLGDEGLSMLSLEFLSRFKLVPDPCIIAVRESLQDVIRQAKSRDIYRKLLLSASSTKNPCILCPLPPKIGLVTSIE
jgi:hypothetical protein